MQEHAGTFWGINGLEGNTGDLRGIQGTNIGEYRIIQEKCVNKVTVDLSKICSALINGKLS